MKKIILILLFTNVLIMGNSMSKKLQKDKRANVKKELQFGSLKIEYYLVDSLGVKKDTFHLNEDIYCYFSVKNLSGKSLVYHQDKYEKDLITGTIVNVMDRNTGIEMIDFGGYYGKQDREQEEKYYHRAYSTVINVFKINLSGYRQIGDYLYSIRFYRYYKINDLNIPTTFPIKFKRIGD